MRNGIDAATAVVGMGLGRRHLFKTVAALWGATVVAGRETFASETSALGKATETHAVELYLLTGNQYGPSRLVIRDRQPAKIIRPDGRTVTLIPHVLTNRTGIELSIYDGKDMKLDKRMPLEFGKGPTSLATALLAGMSVHTPRLVPFGGLEGGTDCCVTCCQGIEVCASGVCCDTENSNCGACCDYGSCQPDCNCCRPPA